MTSRTQITLDRELQRRAREKADAQGISFAEYVRQVIANDVGPPARPDISIIFDLGGSEETDVARDKDEMLAEAILKSRRRR